MDDRILVAAAQWGSEQAQQTTHEQIYETIVKWDEGGGKRSRRELARRIEALLAQQTTEPELPEAVGYVTQGYFTLGDGRIVETPEGANTIPLYATPPAKMHDYAAAKVREAMARQNADAKLNYAPLYDYAQANRIDYNHLCAVVREAMQGDNHEQRHKRTV